MTLSSIEEPASRRAAAPSGGGFADSLAAAVERLDEPVFVRRENGDFHVERHAAVSGSGAVAYAPPLPPASLGDAEFLTEHGIQLPYIAGAMANGIASVAVVQSMSRAGMLGFFGAAGLALPTVEAAIDDLQKSLGSKPFGFNLIHSPNEPDLEAGVVDLYLRRGVGLVEASAYLDLTLPVVRYRLAGLRRGPDGSPVAPNRVVAKVSRVEVAAKFMAPAPAAMVRELVQRGDINADQAELAAHLPMATDLTAEADSGGHTDNRPAITLVPTMLALRDRLQAQYGYRQKLRIGAAGGIATPQGVAAAFAMGAAYVVTGSVNQSCVEAGTSPPVRTMLAQAQQADVIMAPAADMFEMGVKVQVLKRGTMFAMRGAKLYEIYSTYKGIDDIPAAERDKLEKTVFKRPLADVWAGTREYFLQRDPRQVERAEREPKHQMALVFRWYLGMASRWANSGEPTRQVDYQVWCGPAMGAFNEWVRGTFLEGVENRTVEVVALNLLYHAAVVTRLNMLRMQGVPVPAAAELRTPLPLDTIRSRIPSQRTRP